MKRIWLVWLVFAGCILGAAAAMAWLTRQAIESDRQRQVAQANAELEQSVSLALWRMDTELAPIIAQEVIRPVSDFRTVESPSAGATEYVRLHFEVRPDGTWHSPQRQRQQALTELAAVAKFPQLLQRLPSAQLPSTTQAETQQLVQNAPNASNVANVAANSRPYFEGNPFDASTDDLFGPSTAESPNQADMTNVQQVAQAPAGKGAKNSKRADFEQRNQRFQSATQQSLSNYMEQQRVNSVNQVEPAMDREGNSPSEIMGVSRPIWVGERLLLARRVSSNGKSVVQGCWLDWKKLKGRLLAEAEDLLPQADLAPVTSEASLDPGRMLAGLPVRLEVGTVAPLVAALSPALRFSLWLGWGALAAVTVAAAALLYGVTALSERRAAFVSSVSHELRTPLTTFRMYAEMLARGMVPDAERRQEYLDTLQHEAERLTLLVENVLAYARLERGRRPQADDHVSVASLVERIGPRLAHRAAQADMQCDVELDATAGGQEITTDANIVEQILFNLVDNAAKYARNATDRQIRVAAERNGTWLKIAVCDHGPGFAANGRGLRLQPFAKSAEESAETAPGVGLGLALCRRMARQIGGRLEMATTPGGGATVTLCLPAG